MMSHVTYPRHLPGIMENGVLPKSVTGLQGLTTYGDPDDFVWLTDNPVHIYITQMGPGPHAFVKVDVDIDDCAHSIYKCPRSGKWVHAPHEYIIDRVTVDKIKGVTFFKTSAALAGHNQVDSPGNDVTI